jgi:hypothetical protein
MLYRRQITKCDFSSPNSLCKFAKRFVATGEVFTGSSRIVATGLADLVIICSRGRRAGLLK